MESAMAKSDEAAFRRLTTKIPKATLARCLGIARQSVNDWGGIVPDRYIFQVSILSGIPPGDLRPELQAHMEKVRDKMIAPDKQPE
jgi:hypothetical protein